MSKNSKSVSKKFAAYHCLNPLGCAVPITR